MKCIHCRNKEFVYQLNIFGSEDLCCARCGHDLREGEIECLSHLKVEKVPEKQQSLNL